MGLIRAKSAHKGIMKQLLKDQHVLPRQASSEVTPHCLWLEHVAMIIIGSTNIVVNVVTVIVNTITTNTITISIIISQASHSTAGEEQVTTLSYQHNNISRITGLEQVPQLAILDMYSNQIQSMQGLPKAPLLRGLMLGRNFLSALNGLEVSCL